MWKFFIKGYQGRRTYGPYIAVSGQTHNGSPARLVATKPNGQTTTFGKKSGKFTIVAERVTR